MDIAKINLFYHFFSFIPGITLFIYMAIAYFSYRNSYLGLFALAYLGTSALAFCFLTHSFNQYLDISSADTITHLEILSISLVVWSTTLFTAKIIYNSIKRIVHASIIAAAIMPIVFYILLLANIIKSDIIIDMLYLYFYAVLIFNCILFIIKIKQINDDKYRKFGSVFIFMLSCALVIFLLQAIIEKFVFNFFPLFYLIITVLLVKFSWSQIINERVAKAFNVNNSFVAKHNITERELEIIKLIIKGHSSISIGKQLFISERTVDNHLYNIYKKLDISSRFELIYLFKQ